MSEKHGQTEKETMPDKEGEREISRKRVAGHWAWSPGEKAAEVERGQAERRPKE